MFIGAWRKAEDGKSLVQETGSQRAGNDARGDRCAQAGAAEAAEARSSLGGKRRAQRPPGGSLAQLSQAVQERSASASVLLRGCCLPSGDPTLSCPGLLLSFPCHSPRPAAEVARIQFLSPRPEVWSPPLRFSHVKASLSLEVAHPLSRSRAVPAIPAFSTGRAPCLWLPLGFIFVCLLACDG